MALLIEHQRQKSPSGINLGAFSAVVDAPVVTDDNGHLLSPGDAGVEQIAVVHVSVGLVDDQDRAGHLGSLVAVDGCSVGQLEVEHGALGSIRFLLHGRRSRLS